MRSRAGVPPEESGREDSVRRVAGGPPTEGSGPLPPSSAPSVRPRGITLGPEGSAEGQPDDRRPVTMDSTGFVSWTFSAAGRGTVGQKEIIKKERKKVLPEILPSWVSSECPIKSAKKNICRKY